MVGAVGQDALAPPALQLLQDSGVNLACLRRIPGLSTGCASICTDSCGRNQIAVALGANTQLCAADLPDALLKPDAILLVQMEADPDQVAIAMRRAHAAGMRVVLNLAPARPLPLAVLRHAAVIIVNEDEAAELASHTGCPASAAALHEALGPAIIVTLGSAGAEAAGPQGPVRVGAPRIQAVDTTAAGDCFAGVLAANLLPNAPLSAHHDPRLRRRRSRLHASRQPAQPSHRGQPSTPSCAHS